MSTVFEFGDNDNGPVSWNSLAKKPAEYPPLPHRHDASDIDGLEGGTGGGSGVVDYGIRIIQANEADGWTGGVALHRVGNMVSIFAPNISTHSVSDPSTPLFYIPAGFRPAGPYNRAILAANDSGETLIYLSVLPGEEYWSVISVVPLASVSSLFVPTYTFFTSDDVPETMPGVELPTA